MRALGLRARLALAMGATALLASLLATLLANRGLQPRVAEAAHARLERSARHVAELAQTLYAGEGRWSPRTVRSLVHLGRIDGLRVAIRRPDGSLAGDRGVPAARDTAATPLRVGGVPVGDLVVAPREGLLLPEEAHLQRSLDRLHLIAGAIALAGAVLLGLVLAERIASPLRRIRAAAERIGEGDLDARVEPKGGPELRAVAQSLNRLAQTLEQEEQLRRETVADLAHELRTPVNGLLARIEAAQDRVLPEGRNLAAMHEEALRLTALLGDLARLAEAQRPGLLLAKEPVDLAEVAATAADELAPRFADRGIELRRALGPATVDGERDRLVQVAVNLLANALRYTDPGGSVEIRTARSGERALLDVADTGVGIAPDDLPHLFKRFWRGEPSRSRATGGAGIGLAIVEELVRAHEGRVDVESAPGRGSRFRVELRASPGARG